MYHIMPIHYILIFTMVALPMGLLLCAAYRSTHPKQVSMAQYRKMINYHGAAHDGSVEYVLTNTQIKALAKPILFDQDGYFPTKED